MYYEAATVCLVSHTHNVRQIIFSCSLAACRLYSALRFGFVDIVIYLFESIFLPTYKCIQVPS